MFHYLEQELDPMNLHISHASPFVQYLGTK
jgi:hypothetical protein